MRSRLPACWLSCWTTSVVSSAQPDNPQSGSEQLGRRCQRQWRAAYHVIGHNSGAIPEAIDNAGPIVPEGDVDALAAAIVQLVTRRPNSVKT